MKKLLIVLVFILVFVTGYSIPKLRVTNGRAYCIEEYLDKNASDPKSIEYIENSVLIEYSNGMFTQLVRFRGKNKLGGYTIMEYVFTMTGDGYNAKVVAHDTPESMTRFVLSNKLKVVAKYGPGGSRYYDR